MPRICKNCGKENDIFMNPLYLNEKYILCDKCISPVRNELDNLRFIKTKEKFDILTKYIYYYCFKNFNDEITNDVCQVINKICEKTGYKLDQKTTEDYKRHFEQW